MIRRRLCERCRRPLHHIRMAGIGDDDLRHVFNRQYEINGPRPDRRSWHPIVFSRFGVLNDRHSSACFHLAETRRAVAPSAREYDTNGSLLPRLRQRPKEVIDWQPHSTNRDGRLQEQSAVHDPDELVRGNHVYVIRLYGHGIPRLQHTHARISRQQLDHQTLVSRIKMLY